MGTPRGFCFLKVWGGQGDFYACGCVCFFDGGFVSAGFILPLSFPKRKRRKENAKGGLGAVCFIKASLDETAHAPSPLWIPPTPHLGNRSLKKQRESY